MSILALVSWFGLFKRTSRKCIPSGLIHAKDMSFSTKRNLVKSYKTHGIKGTISSWKVSKNSIQLWFIDWMPKQAHRQKNFAGSFHLQPQPNGAMQNYSIQRPGYRSVRFKIPSVLLVYSQHIATQYVKKKSLVYTEFYASRKRTMSWFWFVSYFCSCYSVEYHALFLM